MDNHRRKSIHNGQPLGEGVKIEEADSLTFDAPRQSPSPNAIYSGVDLANQLRQKNSQYRQEQLEKAESDTVDHPEEKGNPSASPFLSFRARFAKSIIKRHTVRLGNFVIVLGNQDQRLPERSGV